MQGVESGNKNCSEKGNDSYSLRDKVPRILRYNTAREESVFSQNLKEKWEQLIRELPFHKNSQMFKK